MDRQIWQWTLSKEAIAPCFVRDVFSMCQNAKGDADFFWLGHTPCRTVLLVGMVVGIQTYDKRAIYTIDDGTAVIDCVLRHPQPTLPVLRSPPRSTGAPSIKSNPQRLSPKKSCLNKTKLEPPPPITGLGYPVRVVGRVVRHYQSKQIYADTIDPCPSSLDEITHLERVVELHKTKYSLTVPFAPPLETTSRLPLDTSTPHAGADADDSLFSNKSIPPALDNKPYVLPPPPILMPLQTRNRPPSVPIHRQSTYHDPTHIPSSPAASSIASSTPSSPCKPLSPIKVHEAARHTKLRHPSRLHTRDLTGNTFRLYIKHYMDNAPPTFPAWSSPTQSTCGKVSTPTKRKQDGDEHDEPTPRPRQIGGNETRDPEVDEGPILGFTLSHLRRVPELALLAARVVRAEARRRDKAEREKERGGGHSRVPSSSSVSSKHATDPPRKKIKRLFSWAVVKLYEEGCIVLWDGEARPLPVPPPPVLKGADRDGSGLWKADDTRSTFGDPSVCSRSYASSTPGDLSGSASVLYTWSASASLYSHYHLPRRSGKCGQVGYGQDVDVDIDADPGCVSDPGVDEEAYVPLTPRLLAKYVREAVGALRCGHRRGGAGVSGRGTEPTPEDILAHLHRADGRWARVGVWVVEEALAVLKGLELGRAVS